MFNIVMKYPLPTCTRCKHNTAIAKSISNDHGKTVEWLCEWCIAKEAKESTVANTEPIGLDYCVIRK